MTDRPGSGHEERLPAPRPPSEPVRADRFSAPPSAHAFELTPERAAGIVRQSSNARWVSVIAVSVVVLFVIFYYFYELGLPGGLSSPRLTAEEQQQHVVAVERGYNLYEANCARCHGAKGEGGIGPVLNDQMKLFVHLNESYLRNVLLVGGRYVCGKADSAMPVWSQENGGPLNYRQIDELIAFLRAPSSEEYEVRDPELNEPTGETFHGWRDEGFKPAADATPVPACHSGDVGSGTPGPAPSLGPDATIVKVTAQNVAFDVKELAAPAGQVFGIDFTQKDAGVGGHDVDIRSADGKVLFNNPVLADPGETTYAVGPLDAGTYTFICSVHPIPGMTGTLTVN